MAKNPAHALPASVALWATVVVVVNGPTIRTVSTWGNFSAYRTSATLCRECRVEINSVAVAASILASVSRATVLALPLSSGLVCTIVRSETVQRFRFTATVAVLDTQPEQGHSYSVILGGLTIRGSAGH